MTEQKGGNIRNKQGRFVPGASGNPEGRPPETPGQKLHKEIKSKAVKELVEEYRSLLAESLPRIGQVLIKQAKEGNITAIREINAMVVGKPKEEETEADRPWLNFTITDDQSRTIAEETLLRLGSNKFIPTVPNPYHPKRREDQKEVNADIQQLKSDLFPNESG